MSKYGNIFIKKLILAIVSFVVLTLILVIGYRMCFVISDIDNNEDANNNNYNKNNILIPNNDLSSTHTGLPNDSAIHTDPLVSLSVSIVIDSSIRYQTIDGFGGTIGWIYPPNNIRSKVADLLFNDLGVSILRVSALGRNYDTTDQGSLETKNDNSDPDIVNWDAFDFDGCEKEQASIIQLGRERGLETVIAASWSPPAWMKSNNNRNSGGRLKPDCRSEFAELLSVYVRGMQNRFGVTIDYITIQNEPEVIPRSYPTGQFDKDELTLAAVTVADRFERDRVSAILLGPDVSNKDYLPVYLWTWLSEDKLKRHSRIVSTHGYNLSYNFHDSDLYADGWLAISQYAKEKGIKIWMTEFSNYSGAFSGDAPGSYDEAFNWARHIHQILTIGHCSAVLWWGLYFDKVEESLIYAENSETTDYTITPKFYSSKHYFRTIRPGAVRIVANGNLDGIECSAFYHKENQETIVVIINSKSQFVKAEINGIIDTKENITRVSITEEKKYWETKTYEKMPDYIILPPKSITSIVTSINK